MTPLGKRLGALVRECRLEREMTQAELAEVLGTEQSAVAHIETRGCFNLTTLQAVASAVDAELVIDLRLRS